MAVSPAPPPNSCIELPLNEARARFVQLVRLASLTHQVTTIVERGNPVAAIVPVALLDTQRDRLDVSAIADGWARRLERVREHLRIQHAAQVGELREALGAAWAMVDQLCPPGTDRQVDTQRAAHAHLRKP